MPLRDGGSSIRAVRRMPRPGGFTLKAPVTNHTAVPNAALQGVAVTNLTWDQVIDKIYYGNDPSNPNSLTNAGLGNPSNGRTPDVIVTLKPGFIFVGNQNK